MLQLLLGPPASMHNAIGFDQKLGPICCSLGGKLNAQQSWPKVVKEEAAATVAAAVAVTQYAHYSCV